MNPVEEYIRDEATQFAKSHKKAIAKRITDKTVYLPEPEPVSVFMAGSPGAGKTEASTALLNLFSNTRVVRIDPDDLRHEFEAYKGGNAWLFQAAVSILVDKIMDMVIENRQSFLLDGTLSNYDIAVRNIERSLNKKRFVQILYVYQDPLLAWEFVQARETTEGRRILPEHFVAQYFAARDVVNRLKLEFGKRIKVDLLLKSNDNSDRLYKAGIDKIDYHIPEKHSQESLAAALGLKGSPK